jgi:hypothetical protein
MEGRFDEKGFVILKSIEEDSSRTAKPISEGLTSPGLKEGIGVLIIDSIREVEWVGRTLTALPSRRSRSKAVNQVSPGRRWTQAIHRPKSRNMRQTGQVPDNYPPSTYRIVSSMMLFFMHRKTFV